MSANGIPKSDEECVRRFEKWDDEALAWTARAGDRGARNALFLRHEALVRRLGSHARYIVQVATWAGRVNVPLDPEDVDQQAFVAFCEVLAAWPPDGGEPFMAYLKRKLPWLLRNYVHAALAGKGGDPHLKTTPLDPQVEQGHARGTTSAGASTSEEAEDNAAWGLHMAALPEVLRGTVALRYGDDLASAQIARLIGHSKRAVNRRLHEALDILRSEMQEGWEDV